MDRNENGLPRSATGGATVGRDCTGRVRSGTNGTNGTNGSNGMNGNGTDIGNMGDTGVGFGCGPQSDGVGCVDCLDTKPLAYSYNPIQRWQMLYTVDKALGRGTLFEDLDKPMGVYGNE